METVFKRENKKTPCSQHEACQNSFKYNGISSNHIPLNAGNDD